MKPLRVCIALAMLAAAAFIYFRSPPTAQPSIATTPATSTHEDARVLAAKLEQLQRELDALKAREDAGSEAPAVQKVQAPVEERPDAIVETSAEEVRAS